MYFYIYIFQKLLILRVNIQNNLKTNKRVGFKYYVKENWKRSRNIYIDDIHIPYIPQLGNGYKNDVFKDECENILIL